MTQVMHARHPQQQPVRAIMHGNIKDPNYMTKAQCAEFLGVTIRTIENWQRFRALPCVKIGKIATFRKAEVIAWLDAIPSVTRGEAEHWKHRDGDGWRITPRPNDKVSDPAL